MHKSIYILMIVEKLYRTPDGTAWKPIFPKRKLQVEWLTKSQLYVRGMGGGFSLLRYGADGTHVYFRKPLEAATQKNISHRIALEDYLRLEAKAKQAISKPID